MPFPTPGKDDVEIQMISWYSDNSDEFKDDDSESSEYDSEEEDEKKKFQIDNSKFTIHIFGKDINEKTYCIKVEDFTPYFYVMFYCREINLRPNLSVWLVSLRFRFPEAW